MDKDTILDYVTETPGNTNRAVLGSMLDSIEGGGGSEVLVVHFKNSEDSVSPFVDYICDTEITVIQEALDNGTPVIGFVEAWMSGTKEEMDPFFFFYNQQGYISATVQYTLLNSTHKDFNIFKMLDEITACIKAIKKYLINLGFSGDKLKLVIISLNILSFTKTKFLYK